MGLRHNNFAAVQGFAPTEIKTATAGTPLDTSNTLAIRIASDSEYYIGAASGNTAIMPAGVTIIDKSVNSITFTSNTVVEAMYE